MFCDAPCVTEDDDSVRFETRNAPVGARGPRGSVWGGGPLNGQCYVSMCWQCLSSVMAAYACPILVFDAILSYVLGWYLALTLPLLLTWLFLLDLFSSVQVAVCLVLLNVLAGFRVIPLRCGTLRHLR